MPGIFDRLFGQSKPSDQGRVVREFNSKIVGVSHSNPSGTSRQALLAKLRVGEAVRLVPDPDNQFDENAVKVISLNNEQLGFLSAELAARISGELQRGKKFRVLVSDLTGGDGRKKTRGCNILIQVLE